MSVTAATGPRAPWHLWLVGIVTLLWNAVGTFDYVMTQSRNADYLGQFSPQQLAFFESFPAWAMASWAVAVFSGVLGSALLLFRSRYAVVAFGLSLLAIAVTSIHNWVLAYAEALKIMSPLGLAISALVIAVAVFLYVYAKRLTTSRVLR